MSPFSPTVPPTTLIVPFEPLTETITGMASVLHANAYNTNFALYSVCDEGVWPYCNFRYRYVIQVLAADAARAAAAKAAIV